MRDLFSSTGTANLLTNIATAENALFVEAGVADGEPVARFGGYGGGADPRFAETGEPIYGKVARPLDEVLLDS